PDTQPRRCRRDVLDQDLRRRAGDARHPVMLGEPVTEISETLGVLREIDRFTQCVGGRGTGAYGYQIEYRERNHEAIVSGSWKGDRRGKPDTPGEIHESRLTPQDIQPADAQKRHRRRPLEIRTLEQRVALVGLPEREHQRTSPERRHVVARCETLVERAGNLFSALAKTGDRQRLAQLRREVDRRWRQFHRALEHRDRLVISMKTSEGDASAPETEPGISPQIQGHLARLE